MPSRVDQNLKVLSVKQRKKELVKMTEQQRTVVRLSYYKRLVCILKFKKGYLAAIICYILLISVVLVIVSCPSVITSLFFAGHSISTIAGIFLLFIYVALILAFLLKMTINFYMKPQYRDIVVSHDNRKDCILTPEAIAYFEKIISKDEEVTSESQEKDPFDISVSTKFLTVV